MIIDLHVHTFPNSSCSVLRVADLMARVKELGIDGICLTEHDLVWPEEEVAKLVDEHGIVVLRGMEVSTTVGHVLVYGLDRYAPGIWDVRRLRQVVDEVGGVMMAAHPMREAYRKVSLEEMPLLFDALEVLNGGESGDNNAAALDLSVKLGMKGIGGSDSHSVMELGTCATEFEVAISREADLIAALKSNVYHPRRLK